MDPVNNDKEKSSASSSEAASSSSEASGSSTRPARALSMVTPAPQSGGDRRCTLIKSASGAHFQPTRNLRSLNVSSSEPSSSESESSRLEGKRKKTIPIIKQQSVIGFIKPITIVNEELIKDPRVERLNALISCYNDYIKNGKFQSTKAIITLQKIDFLARQLSLEPSTITVNGWTKRSSYNFIRKWYATSNIASQFQRYNGLDGKQYTPALSTLAQYYCCELLARKVRNPKFKEYKGLSDKIQAALSMAIRTETAFLERASSVSIESLETNYYYSLQELKFCVLSELSLNNSDLIEDKNKRRQLNDLLSVVDAKLFPLMKKSTALSKKFAMHRYVNEKYLSDFIENAVADEGKVKGEPVFLEVFSEKSESSESTKLKLKEMVTELDHKGVEQLHAVGNTVIWETKTDTAEKLVIRFERNPNNGLLLEECRYIQQLDPYLPEEYLLFIQMISQNTEVGIVKITDYLEGGDLLKIVANNLDWSLQRRAYFAVTMALQLVTFLMALKDKNIIWADLKAENIGVQTRKLRNKDDEYKIKVLDTKCFLRDDAYLNKAKNTPEAGKGEVISEGSTSAVGQTSSKKEVPQIDAKNKITNSRLIGNLSIPYAPPESNNDNTTVDTDRFMSWLLGITLYSILLGRSTGEDIAKYKKSDEDLSFDDLVFSFEDYTLNENIKSVCKKMLDKNTEVRLTLEEAQEQLTQLQKTLLQLLPELSSSESSGSSQRFWKSMQDTSAIGIEHQEFAKHLYQLKRLLRSEVHNPIAQNLAERMESFLQKFNGLFKLLPNESIDDHADRQKRIYQQQMLFLKSILEEIAVSLKDTSAETSLANMSPEKQKQLSTLVATLYAASPSEPSSKGKAPASFGRG